MYYVCRLKDSSHYFAATRDEAGNYVYTDTSEIVAPEWVDVIKVDTTEQAERVAKLMDGGNGYNSYYTEVAAQHLRDGLMREATVMLLVQRYGIDDQKARSSVRKAAAFLEQMGVI